MRLQRGDRLVGGTPATTAPLMKADEQERSASSSCSSAGEVAGRPPIAVGAVWSRRTPVWCARRRRGRAGGDSGSTRCSNRRTPRCRCGRWRGRCSTRPMTCPRSGVALGHEHLLQVHVLADQAGAVVDEQRQSRVVEVPGDAHRAVADGPDRRPGRGGVVLAGVRALPDAVEYPPASEVARRLVERAR
jgi:hypothetical protein